MHFLKKTGQHIWTVLRNILPFLQVIVTLIAQWFEGRAYNKFAAQRAKDYSVEENDVESVNIEIIDKDMARYTLPLVSEDKEQRTALLAFGKHKSAYILDLQYLQLDFAPRVNRSVITPPPGSSKAGRQYKFSPNYSSIHVFISENGKQVEHFRYVIDGSKHLSTNFKAMFGAPEYRHLIDDTIK